MEKEIEKGETVETKTKKEKNPYFAKLHGDPFGRRGLHE